MNLMTLGMTLAVIGISALAHGAADEPCIRLKNGDMLTVKRITADADGNLEFVDGTGLFLLARSAYDYALIPCPAELVAAEKLLSEHRFEPALATLNGLEKKYGYLGWRNCCIYNRMRALSGLARNAEAVAAGETLRRDEKDDREEAGSEAQYRWRGLRLLADLYIRQDAKDKAMKLFEELSSCGDDEIAADAYNCRADLLLADKKTDEALLLYLRSVVMFERGVTRREYALRQVVKLLRERNDKSAEKFVAMLAKEYPEEAAPAKKP